MKKIQKKSVTKIAKKVTTKVVVTPKKAVKTIYKQLEILTPEEIKFLLMSLPATVDNVVSIVNQQQIVLNELKSTSLIGETSEFIDSVNKSIKLYEDALFHNVKKVELLKGISNKLKAFEGII